MMVPVNVSITGAALADAAKADRSQQRDDGALHVSTSSRPCEA
jgi:hypothetical protein